MSGFLDSMARSSAVRLAAALERESLEALRVRARATPRAPPWRGSPPFAVIAELKLRSPALGQLGTATDDWLARVRAYARGGAAAVSVLTEPERFDGSLEHLQAAAAALAPLGVPAMRKDFLIDPYQVLEARAAGAGGVLVIVRMLSDERIAALVDAAAELDMFVLLEAFDAADLERAAALARGRTRPAAPLLLGLNCRDLQTLQVQPERFAAFAARLPAGFAAVAESGIESSADAVRVRTLGYSGALIGSALMAQADPARLLEEIIAATRTVKP